MDIFEIAKMLGKHLADSPEMARYKVAEAAFLADDMAPALMQTLREKQIAVAQAARNEGISKEEIEACKSEMQLASANLMDNAIASEFIESKGAFEGLMKQVNDTIIFSITGEEPCSSGHCSSCSGCK